MIEALDWPWEKFRGSKSALKWARRDLRDLAELVAMTPDRRVAVQAGGNLGIFPKFLARHFAAVYTFEPGPALFPSLVRNAPEANIIRYQAALDEVRHGVSMSQTRRDGKPDAHEGITHVAGPGIVRTMLLDDLGLETCDLLALDLEGWELYGLRGARTTIRRCRPVVSVEINKHLEEVGVTRDQVRGELRDHGYRFVRWQHSDEVWIPEERHP
jgi:FkbM family methyltransferase